jgi:glycosyltransferase involved in cell wall biosynthesis
MVASMIGMMRVKNEARWIRESVQSFVDLCDQVYVLDDHSTDETPELLAEMHGVTLWRSEFDGLNEVRDKNWMLREIRRRHNRQWILCLDGDEVLYESARVILGAGPDRVSPRGFPVAFPVHYLWDSLEQRRVDGVYQNFARVSLWRDDGITEFAATGLAGFHCGNVPQGVTRPALRRDDLPLAHLGYLCREDRVRKYHWYRAQDPTNRHEDGYRHMVIGDLPELPAQTVARHGGPLVLQPALPLEELSPTLLNISS